MKLIFYLFLFSMISFPYSVKPDSSVITDSSFNTEILTEEGEYNILQELFRDTKTFLVNGKDYFLIPFDLSREELLLTAGIAISIYGIMYSDDFVKRRIGRETIATLNEDVWDIPTRYGIASYANILSLSTYAAGLVTEDKWLKTTGRMMFESLSYSGIAVITLRYVFARNRPYSEKGPHSYNWFLWNNELQSFPSGHTTVAFALSTVLAERINRFYSRVFFYGMASLTAYARVLNNQHWFSDVLTGALLGLGTGFYVINKENAKDNSVINNLSVFPSANGLSVYYKF